MWVAVESAVEMSGLGGNDFAALEFATAGTVAVAPTAVLEARSQTAATSCQTTAPCSYSLETSSWLG